jgi:hypothetical protein
MRVLLAVALVAVLFNASTVASERIGGARLRPQDTRVAQVLKEGAARSATFRALVNRIEASNVIVYIAVTPILKSTLSGSLTWMTRAGDFRYVRASIRTDLAFDQMIATVAHELQHAVEVVEDESVTDDLSLAALYRRIGQPSGSAGRSGWETTAAQQAGTKVRRELVAVPTTVLARAGDSQS